MKGDTDRFNNGEREFEEEDDETDPNEEEGVLGSREEQKRRMIKRKTAEKWITEESVAKPKNGRRLKKTIGSENEELG